MIPTLIKFTWCHFTREIMNRLNNLDDLKKRMVDEIQDYSITLLDLDGTILTCNKGVQHIKGYSPSEIIGQNFSIFYLPNDRQYGLPQKLLSAAKREGRAKSVGKRVKRDGTIFVGSILITAIHNEQGQVEAFTKVTQLIEDNVEK